MIVISVLWDEDDDPAGNVQHIAQHGFTKEEVEYVLFHPEFITVSRSSGLPAAMGYTQFGDYVFVPFEDCGEGQVYPHTIFKV